MSAVGGDIVEITYNHETLGSGTLFPKAAEDNTFDTGGYRSKDEAEAIDGGGQMIDSMTRVRWSLETVISWDMNDKAELDKLVALASSPIPADWTISSINGTVWSGNGKPVGDLQGNGNAATMPLKLSGGGMMKKIVG